MGIEDSAPPAPRDGPDLGVVVLYCNYVVAPRSCDPILGILELRLQREEVLIGLKIWIFFGDGEQPAQRTGELALRLLEFLERLGVCENVRRNLYLRRLCSSLGHLGEHLAFLRGVALHRFYEVRNEVGSALILVEHLAPRGLGALLQRRNGVNAAADEHHARKHYAKGTG